LAFPRNEQELERTVGIARKNGIPYLIMGKGTNLLVRDRGIRGLVINLTLGFRSISAVEGRIRAGAGILLTELIGFAMERGLSGLTPLYGIPGTVGGGLAMNAGAWGSEIGERTESITAMNGTGRARQLSNEDLGFGYRSLDLPKDTIITEGIFFMQPQSRKEIREEIAAYQQKRTGSQPLQSPSAGSVFKNPVGVSAGKMIEELGLKGERIGGAEISRIHGNFIINVGGATADHVLDLICLIKERVHQERGITLEPEVRVVGE
jgi:UDP-N-acetylmuramate dehydrogenase